MDNLNSQNENKFDTPILFLLYNRPQLARQVFSSIRTVRPFRLYIAIDGTNRQIPNDDQMVKESREMVKSIDWPCEVKTMIHEEHLGCKLAVSSAITWFFQNEMEGIILEDDCLPDPTFFGFCQELLEHYRDDERIMAVSGANFQWGRTDSLPQSYYFSCFFHTWGWASWRRAWRHFDPDIKNWPEVKQKGYLSNLFDQAGVNYWIQHFSAVYHGKIDTWDYQWLLAGWLQNGLTILPKINLVTNIGFGAKATHTKTPGAQYSPPRKAMKFPLQHPPFVIRDIQADAFTLKNLFGVSRENKLRKVLGIFSFQSIKIKLKKIITLLR